MTGERTNRRPAPRGVCALVVGIESSFATENKPNGELRGAAREAAEFAHWLLDNEVCRPDRLTLMTAYNEETYLSDEDKQSPKAELDRIKGRTEELRLGDINHVPHSSTRQDFDKWITGQFGPDADDRQFILFWVGHGLTYPFRRFDPRLCLLGADATSSQLRHVELGNLLDAVGMIANKGKGVHQIAFVDACRDPVPPTNEGFLAAGQEVIKSGVRPIGRHSNYRQSIAFAAAPGRTTRTSGWENRTFAQQVLFHVKGLSPGQGPDVLFDDDLSRGVASWLSRAPRFMETAMTFRYLNKRNDWLMCPLEGETEFEIPDDEWNELLDIAQSLDSRRVTASEVRWAALCHAVTLDQVLRQDDGPGGPTRPGALQNLAELFTALYGWPAGEGKLLPPLVVACNFVANGPGSGADARLAQWCRAWAAKRGPDAEEALREAEEARRKMSPGRNFLGVMVDSNPSPGAAGSRKYLLNGFVLKGGRPHSLGSRGPVRDRDVAGEIADLIAVADEFKMIDVFNNTIIDLALPRDLIGRRVEYDVYKEDTRPLGAMYAVAVRDLDRMRGVSARNHGGPRSREIASATLQRMHEHRNVGHTDWFKMIKWIKCDQSHEAKKQAIDRAIGNQAKIGFVLECGRRAVPGDAKSNAASLELAYSLNAGAAMVLSLQHEGGCERCPFRVPDGAQGAGSCQTFKSAKRLIKDALNDPTRQGPFDAPISIREIRQKLRAKGIVIGVLLDGQDHMWADYAGLVSGSR
jgi:hypothetical protein